MNRIAGIIAICLIVLVAASADAQWRAFTTADGLANDILTVMLEDRQRNLWLGTNNGLSRFSSITVRMS